MDFKYLVLTMLVLFAIIELSSGLKCYNCNSDKTCKKPKTITCNSQYADETKKYLDTYYNNVSNYTSNSYICLHHKLEFTSTYSQTTYRGCVYSHTAPCNLPMKQNFAAQLAKRKCIHCDKDKCNSPAIQTGGSLSIIIFSIVAAFFCQTLFKD